MSGKWSPTDTNRRTIKTNQEIGDSKPPVREIKTISGGLTVSGKLKSLK